MATRTRAPDGAPCWVDLWTSDVDGARRFYGELFGWVARDPDPNYGGYFIFLREGVWVAGCMGDMGDMKANNQWKVYLATADAEQTVKLGAASGAEVPVPPMAVGDLGVQVVMTDPTGAAVGAWQPGIFPGITVLGEPGAPSWFELHTRDHDAAVAFYRQVFGWEPIVMGDSDDFRYTAMGDPDGGEPLAGILDASRMLPDGAESSWTFYVDVADVDAAVRQVETLGGAVVAEPESTPYGRMATITDHAGAPMRLRTSAW